MSPPLSILLCALGGEGGGVLAEWLYAAAVRAGHAAQSTSIPGVAQRTGATTYYVEIDPRPGSADSAAAVFSLNPVPGALDLLVSSELLETTRQVAAGLASPGRTQVISATSRALTVAEKMAPADGRLDDAALRAAVQAQARQVDWLDLQALAQAASSAISAVMFGAISGSGALPWPRRVCEDTIRAGGKGVESSLRGFGRAFDAAAALRAQREQGQALLAQALGDTGPAAATSEAPAAPSAVAHDWAVLGRDRVTAYQDEAYARLYDQRLARLDNHRAVRHETARWLALWMCFDDIVAVAARKLAASRLARVRREVGARDDEVVRVYDHFKPGVPELAGLLPAAAARRLQAWDARRRAAGREPWAWPLRLGSHTVHGALLLWLLARARWWRRRGQRWAAEQALIERWLAAVARGADEDPGLGLALARTGRLIKGYGATNERGKANLLHIVEHLATATGPAASRADAVNRALAAAQADEAGTALDQLLRDQGAPPRPQREQVVRFYKRRPA